MAVDYQFLLTRVKGVAVVVGGDSTHFLQNSASGHRNGKGGAISIAGIRR